MSVSSQDWELIKKTFQTLWGYEDFRPPQGEVIQTLLNQKDALIVMPTGSGKSICFQLPALLQNGLTLVISPLTALMENQLQELQAKNLPAALLHHQIPRICKCASFYRETAWAEYFFKKMFNVCSGLVEQFIQKIPEIFKFIFKNLKNMPLKYLKEIKFKKLNKNK